MIPLMINNSFLYVLLLTLYVIFIYILSNRVFIEMKSRNEPFSLKLVYSFATLFLGGISFLAFKFRYTEMNKRQSIKLSIISYFLFLFSFFITPNIYNNITTNSELNFWFFLFLIIFLTLIFIGLTAFLYFMFYVEEFDEEHDFFDRNTTLDY
jgi:hypothetical protein